jgi:predicted GIY-YIG superfamily endonuclease
MIREIFFDVYYIYILHSPSLVKYYVGHSDDPWRRLEEHNHSPHDTFTSKRGTLERTHRSN